MCSIARASRSCSRRVSDAPSALVLSAHLEGQTILYFDSLKLWTHGRVKMPLPDPRVADVHGHVVIPVAEGSHALYPAPGHYHISVLTELAGHVLGSLAALLKLEGEHEDALQTHQVLLPPNVRSSRFASYSLRPLRLDLLRSEPLPPQPALRSRDLACSPSPASGSTCPACRTNASRRSRAARRHRPRGRRKPTSGTGIAAGGGRRRTTATSLRGLRPSVCRMRRSMR